MKITKTFAGVFLITFLIGYVSVLPTRKTTAPEKPEKVNFHPENFLDFSEKNANTKVEPEAPKSKVVPKFEPEIVIDTDVDDDWSKLKIQLLEVGDGHRKEDVKAKSGEIWMGFYKGEDGYFLRSEKTKIYPTTKPNYIEDSKTIEVSGRAEPIVLIGKAKNLRDGEVKTLFSPSSEDEIERLGRDDSLLKSGFVREFILGERKYTLRIKQGVSKTGDRLLALVLETGKKSQIVTYCPYFDESDYSNLQVESYLGHLVWVGDLDRDGKLDLYLDDNTFEKGYSRTLYLSSQAEKGELITVAANIWAGC